MSQFIQNGDVFAPTPGKEAMFDSLPVGNYIVIETMAGLMFKRVDSFPEPGKMYGRVNDRADRILNTFMDRPRTTGVLLSGEKGSGKSQLARNISHAGYEMGLATIIINAPFCGDQFNALLASIEQPAIVLMDEFEKVYSHQEQQEQVLTLLDGLMTSKKLFVLTVNDKYKVNDHMKNRPGRIFYALEFSGLEPDFVREYCEDNLVNKDEAESVVKIGAMFKAFNFDMLKALVEEMNRYKESAFEAVEMLNAKPFSSTEGVKYEAVVRTPGGVLSKAAEVHELPMGNPHGRIGVHFEFDVPIKGGTTKKDEIKTLFKELGLNADDIEDFEEEGECGRSFVIESKHLRRLDADAGRYEFLLQGVNQDGFVVTFSKKATPAYNMYEMGTF